MVLDERLHVLLNNDSIKTIKNDYNLETIVYISQLIYKL